MADGVHVGRSPTSLAAGAIHAASLLGDDRVTLARVAEATGVSEVTIRNRYRELLQAADLPDR